MHNYKINVEGSKDCPWGMSLCVVQVKRHDSILSPGKQKYQSSYASNDCVCLPRGTLRSVGRGAGLCRVSVQSMSV